MEQKKVEKVSVLVIGYDAVKDYMQFKIEKDGFTEQMEKFCKEFKVNFESMKPLPVKPSNEQSEKLSQVKCLIIFNNGEDKKIKKYESFVKKLPIYISTWKTKNGNLINIRLSFFT